MTSVPHEQTRQASRQPGGLGEPDKQYAGSFMGGLRLSQGGYPHYPLIPVTVIPSTKVRCVRKKIRITGKITDSAASFILSNAKLSDVTGCLPAAIPG